MAAPVPGGVDVAEPDGPMGVCDPVGAMVVPLLGGGREPVPVLRGGREPVPVLSRLVVAVPGQYVTTGGVDEEAL